ncbi:MAG: acetyl-CoA carboxylase biotin carboxyl carrier protein [Steroidobacteraceae bacterium]
MTLTAKDVAEITRLLEQSSFDELYLELDGVKLSLRRGGGGTAGGTAAAGVASVHAPAEASPARAPAASGNSNLREVPAPLLGTFYRAPKPGAPAFVEVGSSVDEQTIVGIIEVMKLMNTVRAGVRGRVAEILARDGVLVEYGEALMRVDQTG